MRLTSRAALILLTISVSTGYAQVRLPPVDDCDCPPIGSYWCDLYPDACEECWELCLGERIPPRRMHSNGAPFDPWLMDYRLPRTIGVFQVEYDKHYTTLELFDEVASHGFHVITIWHTGLPFDGMGEFGWTTSWGQELCCMGSDVPVIEDMYKVWTHPDINVIFYRPQSESWVIYASDCPGFETSPVLNGPPYYDIARRLYEEFWWRKMTVVLVDWEQDWLLRGDPCWASGTEAERVEYLKRLLNYRQESVERARKEIYLQLGYRPNLRVMHAVIVNRYPGNVRPGEDPNTPFVVELVNEIEHKPDLIGLTYWLRGGDVTATLEWIRETTGYPYSRIFLQELGEIVPYQEEWFTQTIPQIWDLGSKTINIWLWKEPWCRDKPRQNRGLWVLKKPCAEPVEWTTPTAGYWAIQGLLGRTH